MSALDKRAWIAVSGIGLIATTLVLVTRPSTAIGADRGGGSDLGCYTISGNLTVELVLDPATGPSSTAWTGPIKNVDEVTLLDKWAILRKRDLGTDGSLIVPREKIVFINVGH